MDKWKLDYIENLILRLPQNDAKKFYNCAFYKLSLKRYVANNMGETICFKSTLTYLDYKKIIALCEREALKRNTDLIVEQSLIDFINSKEMYLEKRSRLGIEVKKQDEKLFERFDEYKRIVDLNMSRKLRDKQMWDSFFMCVMKKSGNFSVPGSGKTSSVFGMYIYLKTRALVKRIVVISPKNAFGSWIDEFNICFEDIETLRCLNIHSPIYRSTKDKKQALKLESGGCNLILINYEALNNYSDEIISLIDEQTLLVFDEVHKVKRIGGLHATNALKIAQNAQYVTAMTGTPIPNTYTDIYNFLHILFPDEYDVFFNFSPALLRNPTSDDKANINDKIQSFFCRTTKKQLQVPEANQDEIIIIEANETENELLKILKMKYRKNRFALIIRILQLESSPALLLQSLDLNDFQFLLDDSLAENEIDFADYSEEIKNLIHSYNETSKFRHCVNLTESLVNAGKSIIIWCIFVSSINLLSKCLENKGIKTKIIYGEVELEDRLQIIANFKAGHFNVLLTNPHTLGESVSLHSVCHDAIYFEYSYNLVHLLQSKDRIHRLGLPEGQYTQYYFLQINYIVDDNIWSMDSAIYDRLKEKENIMLDAIDNSLLEAMPTSDEDIDVIFKQLF